MFWWFWSQLDEATLLSSCWIKPPLYQLCLVKQLFKHTFPDQKLLFHHILVVFNFQSTDFGCLGFALSPSLYTSQGFAKSTFYLKWNSKFTKPTNFMERARIIWVFSRVEVGFGFSSDCVRQCWLHWSYRVWLYEGSADDQRIEKSLVARLGTVSSPWTRPSPRVRVTSWACRRMVSWAWSRARQWDRRRNCRVHWLQLGAVVPICNKTMVLGKKIYFWFLDELQTAKRKWSPRKAVVEEMRSIMIAHLRVKIFSPLRVAIPKCYLLMIGNNVVWRICRICTVKVTHFAKSHLQPRIFCKSGFPRKPGSCESSVLRDESIPKRNCVKWSIWKTGEPPTTCEYDPVASHS